MALCAGARPYWSSKNTSLFMLSVLDLFVLKLTSKKPTLFYG